MNPFPKDRVELYNNSVKLLEALHLAIPQMEKPIHNFMSPIEAEELYLLLAEVESNIGCAFNYFKENESLYGTE